MLAVMYELAQGDIDVQAEPLPVGEIYFVAASAEQAKSKNSNKKSVFIG